jgi:hypothetical protein
MNIFILFWVKSFSMVHPICPCFKYENIKTKHLVYILFKMRMKAETYGINFLVASHVLGMSCLCHVYVLYSKAHFTLGVRAKKPWGQL